MIRYLLILHCILFAWKSPAQKETAFCYNGQTRYHQSLYSINPDDIADLSTTGRGNTEGYAPADDPTNTGTRTIFQLHNLPPRLVTFAILNSRFWRTPFDFGQSLYESYVDQQEEKVTVWDEYKSQFARNFFWQTNVGKSRFVMNGAKGITDFFFNKSVEDQLEFVSPRLYRKCTFAYSTPLKWATLGAGVDMRSWALRIFLVTW